MGPWNLAVHMSWRLSQWCRSPLVKRCRKKVLPGGLAMVSGQIPPEARKSTPISAAIFSRVGRRQLRLGKRSENAPTYSGSARLGAQSSAQSGSSVQGSGCRAMKRRMYHVVEMARQALVSGPRRCLEPSARGGTGSDREMTHSCRWGRSGAGCRKGGVYKPAAEIVSTLGRERPRGAVGVLCPFARRDHQVRSGFPVRSDPLRPPCGRRQQRGGSGLPRVQSPDRLTVPRR